MRNTDKTTVGVEARLYERMLIRLSLNRPFRQLGIRVLDRICERCSKSGRCISDLFKDACQHTAADELGCPCWCAMRSCLRSTDKPEPKPDIDAISF